MSYYALANANDFVSRTLQQFSTELTSADSLPLVHNVQLCPEDHSLLLVTTANKAFDNKFKVPLELS